MNQSGMSLLKLGIIILTAATAVIHLALGIPNMLFMFILNGFGYLGLLTAFLLPQFKKYHTLVRWALVAFTAVTIIGWIAFGARTSIAYLDKVVEVVLLALLILDMRRQNS